MKIKELLERQTNYDMSYALRRAAALGLIVHLYGAKYEAFLLDHPGCDLRMDEDSIDLYRADRETVLDFLKVFGVPGLVWKKEGEECEKDKIRYWQEIPHPSPIREGFKFSFHARSAPPPPSCRIVEVEEEVPATKRTVRKVVCDNEEMTNENV